MCAKVLGLNNAKEFEDAALNTSLTSGIQIDMKLINLDGKNYLDYRRTVQSIMAYKMADVDSFYNNGEDHVWKITTKKGFVLNATKDHNVLTFDGNSREYLKDKTTKELQVGNNVLIPIVI